LYRVKSSNESAAITELEKKFYSYRPKSSTFMMKKKIIFSGVLTPGKILHYEGWLEERDVMVGS
jgi:hypothetical protein